MIDLREQYDKLFTQKALLLQTRKDKKRKLQEIRSKIRTRNIAHFLLIETSKALQNQFKHKVEILITNAIQSVYSCPYIFELRFESKRNSIEAQPVIKKGQTVLIPKNDLGGGILDVIALGFQIILWHLQNPKSRPILFLDEPFRFLGDYSKKAGFMLKYLSKSFGVQVVIVSHDKELIEFCDRIYIVSHDGIESTVKRVLKRIHR